MIDDLPSSSRQAALLLYALCDTDKQWLLQELPQAQRHELQGLLGELASLGVPAQPGLLAQLLDGPASLPLQSEGDGMSSAGQAARALDDLSASQVEALAGMLQDEPAQLVAHLLHIQPWPWKTALLERLGGLQRRQVQEALREQADSELQSPPSALRFALIHQLEKRLTMALVPPGRQARLGEVIGTTRTAASWLSRLRRHLPARLATRLPTRLPTRLATRLATRGARL